MYACMYVSYSTLLSLDNLYFTINQLERPLALQKLELYRCGLSEHTAVASLVLYAVITRTGIQYYMYIALTKHGGNAGQYTTCTCYMYMYIHVYMYLEVYACTCSVFQPAI